MQIACCFFYNQENFFGKDCEILYMCNLHKLLCCDKIAGSKFKGKMLSFGGEKCRITIVIHQINAINICFDCDFCYGNDTGNPNIAFNLQRE